MVQFTADQIHNPPSVRIAIGRNLVVITRRPITAATRPSHFQPGRRMPAAVIGCAQPTMPTGGTLSTIAAMA
jgi:hypothetical protein